MAVAPRPKRQKFDLPSSPGTLPLPVAKNERNLASIRSSEVSGAVAKSSEIDLRIQQAKNYAVAQALQDGCTDFDLIEKEHVYAFMHCITQYFFKMGHLQKQIITLERFDLPVSKQ